MTACKKTDLNVHPYADEFPMASKEELEGLAASIAAAGAQYIPAVIARTVEGRPDGRLVDGRNRRKACEMAGVEFRTEERDFATDDELKEFVIGVNTTGRRESMTVQIAAASTALILGAGKRINGQWKRGSVSTEFGTKSEHQTWKNTLARCGLILDILGPKALREVRDGKSLNSVYEQALAAREKERLDRERREREAAEEESAKQFIQSRDVELAALVGSKLHTYVEAKAVWEQRNREEAAALREEEAMRIAARAAELSAWGKACDGILAALSFAASSKPPEDTDRYPAVEVFIERYEALGNHITTWKEN